VNYQARQPLIQALEKVRGSRVISYVMADRETFPPNWPGFMLNLDSQPFLRFVDALRKIGKTKQLDLFLYTRGGATDAVWPLVSLLREYCEKFTVVVPFRAHSGGTLICLGADEVVMTEFAELSPIDPTTGNQFNPPDPLNPQARLGISVEDVASYFTLGEERAGIKETADKVEVFKQLVDKVHPLALGNVQRVHLQIRRLAHNLLALHLDEKSHSKKIEEISEGLTQRFYSHVHAITRREAIPLLGDWARSASDKEASAIWSLFDSYALALKLRDKFYAPQFMGDQQMRDLKVLAGFVETNSDSYVHVTDLKITQRPNLPPNIQIQVPPGAAIPLAPWASRAFDLGIQASGWVPNQEGF
jgi:ClpP class serine protease